jgi:hypothetical protein
LLTINTRLAIPVHSGSRWPEFIGAADAFPCSRKTTPRTTSSTPGISVPTTSPLEASLATPPVPPRADRNTPVQNTTTMTIPV